MKMKPIWMLSVFFLFQCTTLEKGATVKKISYSPEHKSLYGDLYLPKSETKTPAVIVVHGGSWASRAGDMSGICKKLVKQGFAAFNVTYRLAPENRYPKAVVDVRQAISWLMANGSKHNIDTNRVAGWGYSAGGHLILLTGLDPAAGLKAIVSGGTPADLTVWPKSPIVLKFLGHPISTHRKIWEEASPVQHVEKDSPPVFLYHGAGDKLVEPGQMDLMAAALKAKDVAVQTHEVPLLGHMLVYLFSRQSEKLSIEFLKKKLSD